MDATTRHAEIQNLLAAHERVEVDGLAQHFGVSTQTIRSDLRDLSDKGLLSRVHGGAVRVASTSSRGYEDRRKLNAKGKAAMAALVADLVPDNCSLTLNIGTSTEQVARALKEHHGLSIISNNINIINMMIGGRTRELILVGGAIRQSDGAIVGEDAVSFISRYKTDFAIIGASAMDADGAILDHDAREVSVARAILDNARTKVLICDGSKFERTAPVRICALGDLDYLVTDRPVPPDFAEAARHHGTRILIADQSESSENE